MFILNKIREGDKSLSLLRCIFVILVFFVCSITFANGDKTELEHDSGRGFFKPKHDYTDVNLGLDLPVPQTKIPYPIFKISYQDILPWRTWITLNPVHITKNLWKLGCLAFDIVTRILRIIWNTVDIFKLWGAFHKINKTQLKHPGWSSTSDFFDNPDEWK